MNTPMLDIVFQKIAVADPKMEEAKAKALMGGIGAGSLGSSILSAGSGLLAIKTQPRWEPLTEDIIQSIAAKKGLKNIKFKGSLLSSILGGAGYDPATRTIMSAADVPTALHELGHAANHRAAEKILGAKLGDKLYQAYGKYRMPLTMGTGAVGIGMAALGDKKTRKWAPLVAASGGAIMTGEEGLATLRAIKNLKNLHGSWWKALGKGKSLLPALGTYAAFPVAAGGAALLAKHIVDKAEEKRNENTTP